MSDINGTLGVLLRKLCSGLGVLSNSVLATLTFLIPAVVDKVEERWQLEMFIWEGIGVAMMVRFILKLCFQREHPAVLGLVIIWQSGKPTWHPHPWSYLQLGERRKVGKKARVASIHFHQPPVGLTLSCPVVISIDVNCLQREFHQICDGILDLQVNFSKAKWFLKCCKKLINNELHQWWSLSKGEIK